MQRVIFLVVAMLVAGCALPPPTPLATIDDRRMVADRQLSEGAARVYLFVGEGVYGTKPKEPCLFFVNSALIGTGSYDMFVVADLEPGRYRFDWQFAKTNTYFSAIPLELELKANESVEKPDS